MPYHDEDISGRIARVEAKQDSLAESLSRHEHKLILCEQWMNDWKQQIHQTCESCKNVLGKRVEDVRADFDTSVDKLADEIGSLKTRVFGTALALGIIVSVINAVGVAVAVYAAIGGK